MRQIFIIGSKGIPARYGGFETFVQQLTGHKKSPDLHYHVACMGEKREETEEKGTHCFVLTPPPIGPAKAVWYDLQSFRYCLDYLRKNPTVSPIVYVLACRIGPFIGLLKWRLRREDGLLYVNPDGHEWMRAKWNRFIRKYWKFSERLMIKHADMVICDSKHMEQYIQETYAKYHPSTTFIAYGADVKESGLSDGDEKLLSWYQEHGLSGGEYYLIVGRFVPENNYETMLREFMASKTDKKLAIISNVEKNAFYRRLKEMTGFDADERIVFCGTVYEEQLLKKIRENAAGYLHGHEVGGTNPSLLEALGSTNVNLLLDVGFNREVGEEAALYWTKEPGSLAALIDRVSDFDEAQRARMGEAAKCRIADAYGQEQIVDAYEEIFLRRPGSIGSKYAGH